MKIKGLSVNKLRLRDPLGVSSTPPPPVGNPPVNTVLPSISGTFTVGQTLTANTGTWTGDATINYSVEWMSNGVGFYQGDTLVIGAEQAGKTISIRVGADNGVGSTVSAFSAGQVVSLPPSNTVTPTISGALLVGSDLSCSAGTWAGYPAPVITYQWKRDGDDIVGATSSTYTPVVADEQKEIVCRVTATNGAGSSYEEVSAGTVPATSWDMDSTKAFTMDALLETHQEASASLVAGPVTSYSVGSCAATGTPTGVTYSLENKRDSKGFSVNTTTGEVRFVNDVLMRNECLGPTRTFKVIATDGTVTKETVLTITLDMSPYPGRVVPGISFAVGAGVIAPVTGGKDDFNPAEWAVTTVSQRKYLSPLVNGAELENLDLRGYLVDNYYAQKTGCKVKNCIIDASGFTSFPTQDLQMVRAWGGMEIDHCDILGLGRSNRPWAVDGFNMDQGALVYRSRIVDAPNDGFLGGAGTVDECYIMGAAQNNRRGPPVWSVGVGDWYTPVPVVNTGTVTSPATLASGMTLKINGADAVFSSGMTPAQCAAVITPVDTAAGSFGTLNINSASLTVTRTDTTFAINVGDIIRFRGTTRGGGAMVVATAAGVGVNTFTVTALPYFTSTSEGNWHIERAPFLYVRADYNLTAANKLTLTYDGYQWDSEFIPTLLLANVSGTPLTYFGLAATTTPAENAYGSRWGHTDGGQFYHLDGSSGVLVRNSYVDARFFGIDPVNGKFSAQHTAGLFGQGAAPNNRSQKQPIVFEGGVVLGATYHINIPLLNTKLPQTLPVVSGVQTSTISATNYGIIAGTRVTYAGAPGKELVVQSNVGTTITWTTVPDFNITNDQTDANAAYIGSMADAHTVYNGVAFVQENLPGGSSPDNYQVYPPRPQGRWWNCTYLYTGAVYGAGAGGTQYPGGIRNPDIIAPFVTVVASAGTWIKFNFVRQNDTKYEARFSAPGANTYGSWTAIDALGVCSPAGLAAGTYDVQIRGYNDTCIGDISRARLVADGPATTLASVVVAAVPNYDAVASALFSTAATAGAPFTDYEKYGANALIAGLKAADGGNLWPKIGSFSNFIVRDKKQGLISWRDGTTAYTETGGPIWSLPYGGVTANAAGANYIDLDGYRPGFSGDTSASQNSIGEMSYIMTAGQPANGSNGGATHLAGTLRLATANCGIRCGSATEKYDIAAPTNPDWSGFQMWSRRSSSGYDVYHAPKGASSLAMLGTITQASSDPSAINSKVIALGTNVNTSGGVTNSQRSTRDYVAGLIFGGGFTAEQGDAARVLLEGWYRWVRTTL